MKFVNKMNILIFSIINVNNWKKIIKLTKTSFRAVQILFKLIKLAMNVINFSNLIFFNKDVFKIVLIANKNVCLLMDICKLMKLQAKDYKNNIV